MIIHWFQLVPAAILLLIPIGLFHGPKVRYRAIRRAWRGYWGRMFALGLNAIDLGRAALGAWILLQAIEPATDTHLPPWGLPALQSGIVLVAVILQMLVCKEHKSLNACYPFLIGLIFGLHPFPVASFAVLGALVIACGARMPMAFFPLLAILSFVFGLLFGDKSLNTVLVVGAVAALIPWLSSMLFSRALVITYRAKRAETA